MLLFLMSACTASPEIVGDATAGADVYVAACSGCHGADGEGGVGPAMAGAADMTDESLEDLILNGKDEMPAIDLSEQELADLMAYVRATFG